MAVTATVTCNISAEQTKDLSPQDSTSRLRVGRSDGFINTYETTDLDTIYRNSYEIAASGNASIDLSGSLKDLYGDAAVFTKVKSLLIVNHSGDPINGDTATGAGITITGNFITSRFGASSSWSLATTAGYVSKILIDTPSGLTVTNSSADTITITNASGTEVAYVMIAVIGEN